MTVLMWRFQVIARLCGTMSSNCYLIFGPHHPSLLLLLLLSLFQNIYACWKWQVLKQAYLRWSKCKFLVVENGLCAEVELYYGVRTVAWKDEESEVPKI